MRWRVMTAALAAGACGRGGTDAPAAGRAPPEPRTPTETRPIVDAPSPPASAAPTDGGGGFAHHRAPDVATAIREILATGPRVIGFGELHARTDRAQVTSSLAHFTHEVFPVLADQLSDLVLETWVVDPRCGEGARTATAAVEGAMRRPASTKGELASLIDAARAAHVQPHAMRLGCDDYARVAPTGKPVEVELMLDLVTRELGRIAGEAVAVRDKDPRARRLVATYGGALHNDLYPYDSVASWSFARQVNAATGGHYVEVDLYVPELAADDAMSQKEAWFPLVAQADADHVEVIERGPRSYIILLPRATATP
jgi:hypothetical protein